MRPVAETCRVHPLSKLIIKACIKTKALRRSPRPSPFCSWYFLFSLLHCIFPPLPVVRSRSSALATILQHAGHLPHWAPGMCAPRSSHWDLPYVQVLHAAESSPQPQIEATVLLDLARVVASIQHHDPEVSQPCSCQCRGGEPHLGWSGWGWLPSCDRRLPAVRGYFLLGNALGRALVGDAQGCTFVGNNTLGRAFVGDAHGRAWVSDVLVHTPFDPTVLAWYPCTQPRSACGCAHSARHEPGSASAGDADAPCKPTTTAGKYLWVARELPS